MALPSAIFSRLQDVDGMKDGWVVFVGDVLGLNEGRLLVGWLEGSIEG